MSLMSRMSRAVVAGGAVSAAFAVGVVLAWATRARGPADDLIVQVRTAVGSLSSPWMLIPFLAGALCLGVRAGAALGVVSSLAALAGWYLMTVGAPAVTGGSALEEVRRGVADNALYVAAAVVCGPLMGAFGAWWKQSRGLSPAVVAGLLLILEPLGMWGLSWLGRHHVLPSDGLPFGLDRLLLGYSARTAVLVGELVLGIAVLYLFARRENDSASAQG